jgi:hypothetical protein
MRHSAAGGWRGRSWFGRSLLTRFFSFASGRGGIAAASAAAATTRGCCCSSSGRAVMAELEGLGVVYEALNRSVIERDELVRRITAH